MQPLFEYRRKFAGYETRVLELEGNGPPLVLLHGYADSADTWRHVLSELGRRDRRAIAVDLPGFGMADKLRKKEILPQFDKFAAAVVARVAGPQEKAVVAGNSLGGCIALRLAQDGVADLGGVVPIAPAGLDMAGWFTIVRRDPILRTLLSIPTPLPERVVREAVGQAYRTLAFAHAGRIDGQVIDAFTSHHRDRATVRRYLATARRLLPELAAPFDLDRVGCPVLLVWGDKDRMVSARGSEQILAALPDTDYVLIEDCGHCPQIEVAERIAELLAGFTASGWARAAA